MKKDTVSLSDKITEEYIKYVLEKGEAPASVFTFAKILKISESAFYEEFNSFEAIESAIWEEMFIKTLMQSQKEEAYAQYSVREKVLSLYFTWIENLKSNRSYILVTAKHFKKPLYLHKNHTLMAFKARFTDHVNLLIAEGMQSKEIEPRPIPQPLQKYDSLLWANTCYILDFWINDTSRMFEKTDTLIEKSVNTVFDLLAHSPLDTLLDLGKFVFQNRK
jgi:AcrR family transcriptional regulator